MVASRRAHLEVPPRHGEDGNPGDAARLWRLGTVLGLRRGQQLDLHDGPADSLSCVVQGALRACRPFADGRRQITAFLLPGDWCGIDGRDGQRTVLEAITDARVVRLPRRALKAADGEAAGALEDVLRASLEAALARVAVLGQKSARDKLAAFLLDMADRHAGGGPDVHLPMSRGDLGDFLGLRSETVCRTLAQLVAAGLVALPGPQHVRILDRDALSAMGACA